MTYAEAIQFLYGLRVFGAKFGLENTFRLAELAGKPEQKLRFIHVAGTNGKGSTCAMLESIYRAAGLRVGLFTSPHLIAFSERIQVNRNNISEQDVARLVAEMRCILDRGWPGGGGETTQESPPRSADSLGAFSHSHPTFFEVVTVMALRYFAEQRCDLVIWETGLGGRLDATNIVTPLATVITNIAYDHEKWLGSDLASIAAEKAGIIKRGVPVVTGTDEAVALKVIRNFAQTQDALLTTVSNSQTVSDILRAVRLPLLGKHQIKNAMVAIATVNAIQRQIHVEDAVIRSGLSSVQWPGRLQVLEREGQTILLDGAHNIAGAQALAATIHERFPSLKPVLILGVLSDKSWKGISMIVAPLASRIFAVPVSSERAADPAELRDACQEANPAVESRLCASLAEALEAASGEPFVLITGSLYLVGEALTRLQSSSAWMSDERALNEWTVNP